MENSPSYDKETCRHQFDRLCQLALEGEAANYFKHLDYRKQHETLFSEMPVSVVESLYTVDQYDLDHFLFKVFGYDIEVKDALIAEALQNLTEKKRNVILLSYFMEMSDAEIARTMNLVRSTIHEHRKRSLELLKKFMEEKTDGEN